MTPPREVPRENGGEGEIRTREGVSPNGFQALFDVPLPLTDERDMSASGVIRAGKSPPRSSPQAVSRQGQWDAASSVAESASRSVAQRPRMPGMADIGCR